MKDSKKSVSNKNVRNANSKKTLDTGIIKKKKSVSKEKTTPKKSINNYSILLLLIISFIFVIPIFKLFVIPLILSATFTVLFYPLYTWLLKKLRNNKVLSSFISCTVLIIGLLLPTYLLLYTVSGQILKVYENSNIITQKIVNSQDNTLVKNIKKSFIVQILHLNKINWAEISKESIKTAGKFGSKIINKTSKSIMNLLINLGIMIFTMFYLFMDGEQILKRLRYLTPLKYKYEKLLFERFTLISRATIKGTLIIGLTQGTLGSLTLLIGGVKTWLLWGFIMIILSIIPMVGAWLILVPAGIIQILLGNMFSGIFILFVSLIVISNIDNILRPRLVGKDAKMHDLLIFFSTLGGISIFGITGFIVGPVIVSLFVAIVDIYELEFKNELASLENDNS